MKLSEFERNYLITTVNSSNLNNIDFFIDLYGYSQTKPDQAPVFGNEATTYRLHVITKGVVYYTHDEQMVKLTKNSCFVLDPTQKTFFRTSRSQPASYYWISFNGREVRNILKLIGFGDTPTYLKLNVEFMPKIRRLLFNNFTITPEQKPISNFIFMQNFYAVAQLMYDSQQQERSKTTNKKKHADYIEQALAYFQEHYTEPDFKITDLAAHVHLHKNYFSTLFKAELGVPFSTYLAQKRMILAVSLIQQGYTSVTKIAEMVGIPDVSYFTKVFKKYNRISPSEDIAKFR